MQEIVPHVFTFSNLRVGRVYLLTEGDGLTLIDASMASSGKAILTQLESAGHALNAVKRILITHAHPDHVGAVVTLQKATGARLIVPDGERAVIDGEVPIPRAATFLKPPQTLLKGMKADQTLQDGDVLQEVWGGLQAISTPGHAPGHMAYWQPQRRILFCGDVIFNVPRKMRLPLAFLTYDMAENIRSIARLVPLEPEVICFGHGRPVTANAAQFLRDFAKKVGAI